jgi:hypothetical protein
MMQGMALLNGLRTQETEKLTDSGEHQFLEEGDHCHER